MTHHTKLDPVYTGTQTPAQKNHYAVRKDDPEFKEKNRQKSALQREKKKEWWAEVIKDDVCVVEGCEETDPILLIHHHRDPSTKLFNVGDGKFRYCKEKVLAERAKCDIICHKHHYIEHYG